MPERVQAACPRGGADSIVRSVELDGRRWVLTDWTRVPSASDAPPFTCISYSWGKGRAANPLDAGRPVSDRTVPAIEATVRALRPVAIWVDALCVPPEEPERTACLRSMGAIFSSASEVVAVLSPASEAALDQVQRSGRLDEGALLALEDDDWITRAWTYQEVVNSRSARFLTEGRTDAVAGHDLLGALLEATSEYRGAHGLTESGFRAERRSSCGGRRTR
jgi:hypothetical protein